MWINEIYVHFTGYIQFSTGHTLMLWGILDKKE